MKFFYFIRNILYYVIQDIKSIFLKEQVYLRLWKIFIYFSFFLFIFIIIYNSCLHQFFKKNLPYQNEIFKESEI